MRRREAFVTGIKLAGIAAVAGIAQATRQKEGGLPGLVKEIRDSLPFPIANVTLEARPIAIETSQVVETPSAVAMALVATYTPTATPTETAVPPATALPTETATPTATATATAIFTPTPDLRPNLCYPQSFVIPQERWTGISREGEPRLKTEDAVRFFQEQTQAREALFAYLANPGMGIYRPINLKPETAKALDIPPSGDDRMTDLVDNLRFLLGMSEEAYEQATRGQLRLESGSLQALQSMLYRKREERNGQVEVQVLANRQEIKVARELVDACRERWDNSPVVMVEGIDQDGSQLYFAFDGFCGNLFLALKLPPAPPPTAVPPPEEPPEREKPPREKPTPTAVPPQKPVDTPTLGE